MSTLELRPVNVVGLERSVEAHGDASVHHQLLGLSQAAVGHDVQLVDRVLGFDGSHVDRVVAAVEGQRFQGRREVGDLWLLTVGATAAETTIIGTDASGKHSGRARRWVGRGCVGT